MRTGLWFSGAGGSGILVARKADGTWSPPSGIMLHTAGLGFLAGADIYDCVVVINSEKALDAFSKIRCTLGGEISAVAGPVGAGGVLDSEIHARQAPIFTYLKSRGLYAGIQVDGTVVIERTDENERFYGQKVSVAGILKGEVRHPPYETRMLMNTIKAAQGESVDDSMLPQEAAPGDHEFEKDVPIFGLPDATDPDPFGVKALETAGLEIREAGTRSKPSRESFEYRPSPTSPVFAAFHRRSISGASFHQRAKSSTDRGVQTDDLPDSPRKAMSHDGDGFGRHGSISEEPIRPFVNGSSETTNRLAPIGLGINNEDEDDHDADQEPEHAHTEAEVQTVSYGAIHSPTRATGVKMVTIPKRIPPKLPPRNPARKLSMDNDDDGSIAGTTLSEATSPAAVPAEDNVWDEVKLEGVPSSPSKLPKTAEIESIGYQPASSNKLNVLNVPAEFSAKDEDFYSSPSSPAKESGPGYHVEKATALA
jgi:lipid-binding SYLF domain-containing protein